MTQQTPSKVLYDLLGTRNFNPTALPGEKTDDSSNNVSYKFDYKAQSGKDYGTAVAMINDEGLTLYFGNNLGKGMDSSDKNDWFNFLSQLKNLAMINRLPGFHIQDISKLKYTMQGQAAIKEGLFESWAGTKTLQLTGGFTRTQAFLTSSSYTTPVDTPPDPTDTQIGQVPPWLLNLGAAWQATPELSLSVQAKSFPDFWNNTGHTQLNEGATLFDLGFAYQFNKTVRIYGAVQNVFNTNYLAQGLTYTTFQGNTVSSAGVPTLGMPRWFTLGVQATF